MRKPRFERCDGRSGMRVPAPAPGPVLLSLYFTHVCERVCECEYICMDV